MLINEDILYFMALASTWYMVGLIWMVQLVHYPLMSQVGSDQFLAYEKAHVDRMSFVVMPAMLVELASGLALLYMDFSGLHLFLCTLLGLIWATTFFVSIPAHRALSKGFDQSAFKTLLNSNWIRTLSWSLRGIVLLFGWFSYQG